MTLDNNLNLNLYVVLTVYYIVVILEVKILERSEKEYSR